MKAGFVWFEKSLNQPKWVSIKIKKILTNWHNYRSSATTICHVFRNWIGTGRGRSGLRNGVLIINKGDREKSYIVYCLSIQLLWKCFHYHKGKNTSFNEDFECRAIVCIGVSTSPPPQKQPPPLSRQAALPLNWQSVQAPVFK